MNEMKLIEEFCAAVPAPEQERLEAIRTRVLDQAMTPGTQPAPPRPAPSRRRPSRRGLSGIPRPKLALAGAITMAAAVALIVANLIWFGSGTRATAAEVLKHAETAALAQPVPTDKQLIYSDTVIYYATYTTAGKPDGHVLVRQQEWQSPVSPTAFYRTTPCDVDGNLQGKAGCSFQGGYAPGATSYSTYAGLKTLPRSASHLLAYLATLPSPGGLSRDDREWSGANLIAELNPVLPPQFAAALFRAVAQIPGTTPLPSTTNAAGAHGIGLSRSAGAVREELIFDPSTYRLIGEQYTALVHHGGADYVTTATALVHTRFEDAGSASANGGPVPGSISSGPGSHGVGSVASARNDQFIVSDSSVVVMSPLVSRHGTGYKLTLQRGTEWTWQSVDGSRPGALVTTPCRAGNSGCVLLVPPGPENPALFTYAGLRGLPHTASALTSYLGAHSSCPTSNAGGAAKARAAASGRIWATIAAMLGNDLVLPPGLGKAVFRAAEALPGATVLGHITDAAGGHGIAVATNATPALRIELIFAPGSYRFIGIQEVVTRHVLGLRPGTVWAAMSVLSAQVVNAAPVASLSQSYGPSMCGFTPGLISVGSASGGSISSGSSSSGSSSSGSSSSGSGPASPAPPGPGAVGG